MKNLLASTRSKYLFALGVLAIGIGVTSRKVISYPTECSPASQEITYLFKIQYGDLLLLIINKQNKQNFIKWFSF